MSSSSDPSQRAKNESDVLKLIFGGDVLKCQLYDAWNRFHLQICIRVALTTSNGQLLSIDIYFDCPAEYPELPPKFTLLNPVNLTQDFLSDLTKTLNTRIKKFAGSELIYDLCVDAQTLLQAKNVPEKSMHEKMLHRQESTSTPQPQVESVRRPAVRNSFTEHEDDNEGPGEIKKEEELKCRRDQLLKRVGTLGNSIKVELISKPGQLIDVSKIMELEVLRKPVNNCAVEWFGFDHNNVILVTEYRFDSITNKRNKEDLINFETDVKKFVNDVKVRAFPTDNFISQYAFVGIRKEKRAKFSLDLLIGQYVDLDSKCLGVRKVVDELKSKKSLLPRFANHILCGLKTLHEQRFSHGLLNLSSIWMNLDNNFIISDHSLLPEILHLYEQFGQINVDKSKKRQPSISSLRLKDFHEFGDLMKTLSNSFNASKNREVFDDFVSQCAKPDIDAQKLLNHRYLYQGFTSMSNDEDESLLSSANVISIENAGRLVTEYNILGFLGCGGFGSVFLARNKLDGNDYAIKRISLSGMSSKQVERIKNEVSVFSKLSHENITRYYSSWVETVELKSDPRESSTSESYQPNFSLENELPEHIRNLDQQQNEEISHEIEESDESEESSDKESIDSSFNEVGFFTGVKHNPSNKAPVVLPNALSQGTDLSIMFVGDESEGDEAESSIQDHDSRRLEGPRSASFLCLQMEYCSNKTLRSLIDYSNLYINSAMLWRIFKEILLGLQFIHAYNLIHRDIKPGNIFMDSNWSVKIGDFGLATRLATAPTNIEVIKDLIKDKPFLSNYSMTKDVGTMLYIPPEAKRTTSSSRNYDEKFDIYSTGIVLSEMIMKPTDSRSERIACLEKLKTEMLMPTDLMNYLPEAQRKNAETIIKWCLKEDPIERPSANELLEAKLIPNIISDEAKFQKTCTQIAQDTKHRLRYVLFNELFNPILQPSIGFLYDKNYCTEMTKRRPIFKFNCAITDYLSNMFRLHGFSYLPSESIFPSPENYPTENSNIGFAGSLSKPYRVIDENGVILTFPTNLRYGLTRYCAHNGISRLKAYSIDKTYSQSQTVTAFSSHPDVRFEFCVDIIRPESINSGSTAVEMLQLIIEISQKLRLLSTNRWQILLNHTALLKAIGIQFSINDQQRMASFFNLLYEFSSRLKKVEYSTLAFEFVRNFNMSGKQALELIHLLDTPVRSIHKLRENLRPIINTKNNHARTLIETSISELDAIFQSLSHNLDTSLELTFLPSFIYQPLIFSNGVIFSLRVEINDKGKKFWYPILGGGRYDSFLHSNRQSNEQSTSSNSCAYGFNLSVENVAHLLKNTNGNVAEKFGLLSSVLISCTSLAYYEFGLKLANQLREISISCELWNEESTLNDALFDYCREKVINFIIAVVSVDEVIIYVNTFEKSIGNNGFRLLHNRIPLTDAFKFISTRREHNEVDVQKSMEPANLERFESNVPTTASISNVNLVFSVSRGFKITHHLRKKYESHVNVVLGTLVKRFHKNIKIDAFITELPIEILKQIANLERTIGRDQAFVEFEAIANHESSKYKKDVMLLFDELESFFQQVNSNHVVILFCPRYSETFYRILI